MKKGSVLRVALPLVAALASAAVPRTVCAQLTGQAARSARQKAALLSTSGFDPVEGGASLENCIIARADAASKRVWLGRLSCAVGGSGGKAGFRIPALTSSMTLPGARIKATIEVTSVVGPAQLVVLYSGPQGEVAVGAVPIPQPGTYECTSRPFDVPANQSLRASATATFGIFVCDSMMCGLEGKITELKWEF